MNSFFIQFFIALSFGLRVLLAQHWPITDEEAQWIQQMPLLRPLSLESLLLLRWGIIFLFFAFLVVWGQRHRDQQGYIQLSPLILLHFFPVALLSGATLNSFPLVGILFYASLHFWEGSRAFGLKKWLACGLLALMCGLDLSLTITLPGFIFLELQRRQFSKLGNKILWGLSTLAILYFIGPEASTWGPLNAMQREEWAVLGVLGCWAFVHWLKSDPRDPVEPQPWAYFVLPLGGMCFCFPPQPSLKILLVLGLSLYLSWIHQSWLKKSTWRMNVAVLALAVVGIFYSSSQSLKVQMDRYQQFSEYKNLALKTPEALEHPPKLLLCEDRQLATILALVLRREVLVYPSEGPNTSYRYLGASGVWIHPAREEGLRRPTPHLEGLQEWKGLSLGGNSQHGNFIFEKFDRLSMPF